MSGLEDLYREIILDHYRNPRNRGELPVPPAHRAEGFNPLCGDEIVVYLEADSNVVRDLRIAGQGCSISQSSASMMSAAVKGRTVEEARRIIRVFKSMMSIHESSLGSGEGGTPEGPEDRRARTLADSEADASDGEKGGEKGGEKDGEEDGEELRPPTDAELSELGDLAALQGVVKFPVRIKCATLAWNTLSQALNEIGAPA